MYVHFRVERVDIKFKVFRTNRRTSLKPFQAMYSNFKKHLVRTPAAALRYTERNYIALSSLSLKIKDKPCKMKCI